MQVAGSFWNTACTCGLSEQLWWSHSLQWENQGATGF